MSEAIVPFYSLLEKRVREVMNKRSKGKECLEQGEDFMKLADCEAFETDREIILKYIAFSRQFFGEKNE